jgi:hypothetical protein
MGLFGLFGRKTEAKVAEDRPHPLAIAFKEGGSTAEKAFDVLQGHIGSRLRAGGGDAIKIFCDFYDVACDIGNPDSVKRFVSRFLPLLPSSDRQIVEHRCGLDGSKAAQMLKEQEAAYKKLANAFAPMMDGLLKEATDEVHGIMRAGGQPAQQRYWEIYERITESDDAPGLKKFQREHLPLLPQADRDEILREMLGWYQDTPEFRKITKGMSEGEQLRLMEAIVMDD